MATFQGSGRTKATHPFITVLSSANKQAIIRRARYWKESATASVVERAVLQRSNGAGVTGSNVTEKYNTRSGASGTPAQQWSTAPTLTGNPLIILDAGDKPMRNNHWRPARPYAAIFVIDADEVGLDSTSVANTSTNYEIVWAESDDYLNNRARYGRRGRGDYFHHYSLTHQGIRGGLSTAPFARMWNNYCIDGIHYAPDRNPIRYLFGGGGGGATTNQALLASVTVSPTMVRQVNKNVVATVTVTAAMTYVAAFVRSLVAQVAVSAAMTKSTSKSLVANVTVNAAMARVVNKLMAATVTITAAIATGRAFVRSLVATVTVSPAMVRQVNKSLVATVTVQAAINKVVNKLVAATVTVNAAMAKVVSKSIAATVTIAAALTAQKSKLLSLVATVSVNASMARTTSKSLVANVSVSAAMKRLVSKSLVATVTVTGAVARAKTVFVNLAAVVAVTGGMTATYHAASTVVRRARSIILNKFGIY